MRGKAYKTLCDMEAMRITPAYAGKSQMFVGKIVECKGSPPPMRGKVSIIQLPFRLCGITPAYAGKSLAEFGKTSKAWDHPRLCGEKTSNTVNHKTNQGSPPPMRGKEMLARSCQRHKRITPAYAGKSHMQASRRNRPKDHPRLCGEKWRRKMHVYRVSGSPPPMRGKVWLASNAVPQEGITPAYAGKSGL